MFIAVKNYIYDILSLRRESNLYGRLHTDQVILHKKSAVRQTRIIKRRDSPIDDKHNPIFRWNFSQRSVVKLILYSRKFGGLVTIGFHAIPQSHNEVGISSKVSSRREELRKSLKRENLLARIKSGRFVSDEKLSLLRHSVTYKY